MVEYATSEIKELKNTVAIMDELINKYDVNWYSTQDFTTELTSKNKVPTVFNYRTISEISDMEKIIDENNHICVIGEQEIDLSYLLDIKITNSNQEKYKRELTDRKDIRISVLQAEKILEFIKTYHTVPKGIDTTYEELNLLYEALPVLRQGVAAITALRKDGEEYNLENYKKYLIREKEKKLQICVVNGKKWNFDELIIQIKANVNKPVELSKLSNKVAKEIGLTNDEMTNLIMEIIKNNFVVPKVYNSPVNNNVVRCPKCGSTAITTGQKGYSLLTGFWGSNKTVNRCANCGYSWKPGKW